MSSTAIKSKADWATLLVRHKIAAELNTLKSMQGSHRHPVPISGLPFGSGPIVPPTSDDRVPLQLPAPPDIDRPYAPDNLPIDEKYEEYENRSSIAFTSSIPPDDTKALPPRKVCIVGAGVAGLFIALILKQLKIPQLTYDIVEANSRVGGRVYTHHFSEKPHDYYDIGAMRFPDIPIMERTFKLFDHCRLTKIPYGLEGENCPKLFNGHFYVEGASDPHRVSVSNGGHIPDDVVDRFGKILDDTFRPYKEALKNDFQEGFNKLMAADDYSTREVLKRGGPHADEFKLPPHNFFAIQWMETQNTSTGLFDQAFSESVMDSFDFDYPVGDGEEVKWYCIEGGTSLLTDAMRRELEPTEVELGKRVEAISADGVHHEDNGNMWIKCAGEKEPRKGYCTVFNTTPLGCLGRMDLRGLELHPAQKDAIRSLHYDDSVKVALKFKYAWWIKDCGITNAGTAKTDLPLRTCVYPSYNLHDDGPAVLLASYTWAQDATRLGSLVNNAPQQPPSDAELVELILHNLALLHAKFILAGADDAARYEHMHARIKDAYTGDHHAYAWSHDPAAAGAFALFGPGQFSALHPYLKRPIAGGKFHIVGEASSVHHAWIAGALDSALEAVYHFLYRFEMCEHIKQLEDLWGKPPGLDMGREGSAHLQIWLGRQGKEYQVKV